MSVDRAAKCFACQFGKDSGVILKNSLIAFQRFDGDEEQLKKGGVQTGKKNQDFDGFSRAGPRDLVWNGFNGVCLQRCK